MICEASGRARKTWHPKFARPSDSQTEGNNFMKQFAVVVLLVVALVSVGCGSRGNPANINGGWNATLVDSNDKNFFTLGMSLIVNGDGTLSISNFQFTSTSPCLVSAETESGSFT